MSEIYGPGDDKERIKVLERVVELGCTFWDAVDIPIEEIVAATAEVVKERKVRYLGLSECCADVEYSPWSLSIETNGLRQATCELGVAIVAYLPIGRGLLSGSLTSVDDHAAEDLRRMLPRDAPENFSKTWNCTWVLHQKPDFFGIPRTKRMKYLEENLSEEEVSEVRELVEEACPQGEK
ncbi:NADP-dependent oxidoreductase domain-containing protein [Fennellomyces sp. T-0311]|nr:NADP-dependent oxidoreductase domain-containing protein [Fennellomyces sp. T-0311]